MATASWLMAAGAVGLLAGNGWRTDHLAYLLMDLLVAVVYGGAGLVTLPRSRHPVVWILVLSAVGCGASALLTTWLEAVSNHPGWWAPPVLRVLAGIVWVPGTYASIAVLPWLVSRDPAPRWVRPVVGLAVVAIAWRVFGAATARYVGLENPLDGVPGSVHHLSHLLGLWPDRLCVLLGLAGVGRQVWLWRSAGDGSRRGHGWLSISGLFLALAFVPVVVPMPAMVDPIALDISGASLIAAQPFLVGAVLTVVLGQRLWGIDTAVNRATLWLLLSLALVAGYLIVGWMAQRVLAASADVAAVLAFGVMLVASQPLRGWLQGRVDALVYGEAHDPAGLLGSVGEAAGTPPDAARSNLQALVEGLAASLRLGRVEVRDAEGSNVAAVGRPMAHEQAVPLVVHGDQRGALLIAAPPGQVLDPRTRRLVEQVAAVIGVFLALTEVNERLVAARGRLVEVRQEERRVLRRDLHDGLGPALAGIGLGIAAARRRLAEDPAGASALLEDLTCEVRRRAQDVRLLARSVLPVALDDGDLAGALGALAERFESSGTTVEVVVGNLGLLDMKHKLAIYLVASEAVVNAWRHGKAQNVAITVCDGPAGEVVLEVRDDGTGIEERAGLGIGLASMRERATELAGRLSVDGGIDGTTVRMVLP